MVSMWTEFGFTESPYRATPLEANDRDLGLFTERDRGESSKFLTAMDSKQGAVVVVSGDVGIGKTSFVNIQQYLLANELADWGPKLLPCLVMTSPISQDNPRSLAQKMVHNALESIYSYCRDQNMKFPKDCNEIRQWLSHHSATTGVQFSISGFGFGENYILPPVDKATLENWRDILKAMANEVRSELKFNGFIICLDNAETLTHLQLTTLLMAYRDSLFVIDGIWWVLIGQSGLYKNIDSIDRRISQRISGHGVELSHFTLDEFHDLIERRVKVYRNNQDAVSPLSKTIHDLLFQAACGEVRFVLDTANSLIQEVIVTVREEVKQLKAKNPHPQEKSILPRIVMDQALTQTLKKHLIDKQIPDDLARKILKSMTQNVLNDLRNEPGIFDKLIMIVESVNKDDFHRFGFASADMFESEFLEPLWKNGHLFRQAGATIHNYGLKRFLWFGKYFGILN